LYKYISNFKTKNQNKLQTEIVQRDKIIPKATKLRIRIIKACLALRSIGLYISGLWKAAQILHVNLTKNMIQKGSI